MEELVRGWIDEAKSSGLSDDQIKAKAREQLYLSMRAIRGIRAHTRKGPDFWKAVYKEVMKGDGNAVI